MRYCLRIKVGEQKISVANLSFDQLKSEVDGFIDELTITDIEEGKKLTFEIEEVK